MESIAEKTGENGLISLGDSGIIGVMTDERRAPEGQSILLGILITTATGITGTLSWQDHSSRTVEEAKEDFLTVLLSMGQDSVWIHEEPEALTVDFIDN